MKPFKKICRIGIVPTLSGKQSMSVYVTIDWDGRRLSITGVEGPNHHGNCAGSCGQIELKASAFTTYALGWDRNAVDTLALYWRQWHLNDMRAGTPKQENAVRAFHLTHPHADYTEACAYLETLELLIDDGYKYGSAWLHEDVPPAVLEWLAARPDADRPHPWGKDA